jgi:hypothetical protein
MTVSFIAFIGKQNEPIFSFTPEEDAAEALHLQMIAHSALDIVEERVEDAKAARLEDSKAATTSLEPFLGQLFTVDDYRVYGFLSNTKIKAIVIFNQFSDYAADSPRVTAGGTSGQSLREFVLNLYSIYVKDMQNPLQKIEDVCTSERFRSKILQCVRAYQAGGKK